MRRRHSFKKGSFFHVFNKSIANFGIFKDFKNGLRFLQALDYYNDLSPKRSLSMFLINTRDFKPEILTPKANSIVKFLSFCIMPDHYHLLVKILIDNIFSKYISDLENSFTRFFNIKFKRKGPLWQSSFKAVRIKTEEQLLHVSRYIHLNPTTAGLINKSEDWTLSSYKAYITDEKLLKEVLTEISIDSPIRYQKFVEDRKDYQKKLKIIKKHIFE